MRDKNNRLYLLDFGAVKQVSVVAGQTGYSVASTGIYTPGCAPPEQMSGAKVFNCTYLYTLAATCLNLLRGKPPEELYDSFHGS